MKILHSSDWHLGRTLFGRVGGLTLIFAAMSGTRRTVAKLPTEKIMVG